MSATNRNVVENEVTQQPPSNHDSIKYRMDTLPEKHSNYAAETPKCVNVPRIEVHEVQGFEEDRQIYTKSCVFFQK